MKIQGKIIGAGAFFLIGHFASKLIGWDTYLDSRDNVSLFIILCLLILAEGLDEVILLVRQIKDKPNNL